MFFFERNKVNYLMIYYECLVNYIVNLLLNVFSDSLSDYLIEISYLVIQILENLKFICINK